MSNGIKWVGVVSDGGPPSPSDTLLNPGYHLRYIEPGVPGELSKIREEIEEAQDAEAQGVKLMVLQELADVLGAIELYLEQHHKSFTLEDLIAMATVTARAFRSGKRK